MSETCQVKILLQKLNAFTQMSRELAHDFLEHHVEKKGILNDVL